VSKLGNKFVETDTPSEKPWAGLPDATFKTKNWFILEGLNWKRLVHLYIYGQLEYINAFVIHIL
jgi:hypothetical protein